MSRALQFRSVVNFRMLVHPMQCDSKDVRNNVRVNKKIPQSQEKVNVLGKILASLKSMAILPLPFAAPVPLPMGRMLCNKDIHCTEVYFVTIFHFSFRMYFPISFCLAHKGQLM